MDGHERFDGLPDLAPLTLDPPPDERERDEPELVSGPFFVEFEDPALIDPARAEPIPDEVPAIPPATARRSLRASGPFGSVLIHLFVVLAIVLWQVKPVEAPPIPVQLVFEPPPEPPPEPEQAPAAPKSPPPGRLASEDMGDPTKPAKTGSGAPEQPDPKPAKEAAPQSPTPPEPQPPKQPVAQAPQKPVPAPPVRKPPPPKPAAAAPGPPHPKEPPREAVRTARTPGPTATRDEYLAYLLTLTKRHLDLLPMSLIGDRRGQTVIGIRVLDDGTIARIAVVESSGYPDIDSRVEQMVAAVGRFPPLPQWTQAPAVDLQLSLRFPEALHDRD